jgi:hypothetical protein
MSIISQLSRRAGIMNETVNKKNQSEFSVTINVKLDDSIADFQSYRLTGFECNVHEGIARITIKLKQ